MNLKITDSKKDKTYWKRLTVSLCIAAIVFTAVWHIGTVLGIVSSFIGFFSTVIIGAVVAYVMDPFVSFIERRFFKNLKGKAIGRNLSVLIAVSAVIVLFVLLMMALIPQVIGSVMSFVSNIDNYEADLAKMLEDLSASGVSIDTTAIMTGVKNALSSITEYFGENTGSIIHSSVNIGASVINFVVALFVAIYILVEKNMLKKGAADFFALVFRKKNYENFIDFWSRCNRILIRYIVFDILDGIFVGVTNAIFMIICGYPYVVLISVLVGVTNLAPTFGPIVGGILGTLFLFIVNPWYALGFALFTLALQTFDGYIFKPKVFGNTFGVSSLMILVAIVVFGKMFGVVGILLAIPLAAILDFVYRDFVRRERRDNAAEEQTTDSSADL